MGFKPKRFDVAGMHPDEVYRAVANIAESVNDLHRQVGGDVEYGKIVLWLSDKPQRFGNASDADVQRFLERGVKLMDQLKEKHPLGFSEPQRKVRDRCDELGKSMLKVLERRPDERLPFDPWRQVKISVEKAEGNGRNPLLSMETRDRYRLALSGCFPRGPGEADRARTQYRIWEQNSERFHKDGPMNDSAQSWKRFMGVIQNMRSREEAKGIIWGRVDDVSGIDFKPAMQQQQSFRPRQRQRM